MLQLGEGDFLGWLLLLLVVAAVLWACFWALSLIRELRISRQEVRPFQWVGPMPRGRRLNFLAYSAVCAPTLVIASLALASSSRFVSVLWLLAMLCYVAVYDRLTRRRPAWRMWRDVSDGTRGLGGGPEVPPRIQDPKTTAAGSMKTRLRSACTDDPTWAEGEGGRRLHRARARPRS